MSKLSDKGTYVGTKLGNFAGGDGEDFPILCETCLGDNPYIRMTREPHGKACKICERPFTVYRWQPGPKARFKKTELCHTCAKLKNVCQTCVLDLKYGLPVEVRDSGLEDHEKAKAPTSDLNREYMIEQYERDLQTGTNRTGMNLEGGEAGQGYGKAAAAHQMLNSLQRKQPYYQRNAPHICSFFVKGTCNRGALCPYRHEMPPQGELAHQNIKDRYYGNNDPVAKKMLKKFTQAPAQAATPPTDQTITTLWVGNLDEKVTEEELRGVFSKFGEAQYRMVPAKACAFVSFNARPAAEAAMLALFNKLSVHGHSLRLAWGRRKETPSVSHSSAQGITHENANAHVGSSVPAGGAAQDLGPAPPGMEGGPVRYPSQDPRFLAAKVPTA